MHVRITIPVLLGSVAALLGSCSEPTKQKHVTCATPPPAVPDSAAFRSYRRTLQRLADADWQDRQAIFKVFRQYGFRSAPADSANRWLMRQDSVRLHTFQTLERRYGWPRTSITGREGTQQAYLLVQHAPPTVQASYQEVLQAAHTRGELRSPDYATYLDRVLVNQGRAQRYGTQSDRRTLASGQEEEYLLPVEDVPTLDHRRATMGLEPILVQLRPGTLTLKPEAK